MIPLDPASARLLWDIGQTTVLLAIGLHQYLISRDRVRREALEALRKEIDQRLTTIAAHADDTAREQGEQLIRLDATQRPPGACEAHARAEAAMTARLSVVEEAARHAPTRADISAVEGKAHQRMDVISEALAELKGGVRRIEGTLDMLSQHLLRSGSQP